MSDKWDFKTALAVTDLLMKCGADRAAEDYVREKVGEELFRLYLKDQVRSEEP